MARKQGSKIEDKGTTQVNIRLNKTLLSDLDLISRILGVSRSEWIKVKFAETVLNEKEKLLSKVDDSFMAERIDEHKYKELTGYPPSNQLVLKCMGAKDAAKNYIKDLLKKV
jgi:hypothetical protein